MVYFLGRDNPPLLFALFAERVGGYVTVTDTLPCPVITFLHGGITVVTFVPARFLLCVFLTEPVIRQLGAAGKGTWFLRFIGQRGYTSLQVNKKPRGYFPVKALVILLDGINISCQYANVTSAFPHY